MLLGAYDYITKPFNLEFLKSGYSRSISPADRRTSSTSAGPARNPPRRSRSISERRDGMGWSRQPRGSSGQLACCLDLGVDLLVPEVDRRDSDPIELAEEGHSVHARQACRLSGGQTTDFIELGCCQERQLASEFKVRQLQELGKPGRVLDHCLLDISHTRSIARSVKDIVGEGSGKRESAGGGDFTPPHPSPTPRSGPC